MVSMTHLLLVVIYLTFISLGLPDSLLGAAWPHIYTPFGVPVSASGPVFMIISLGTVFSSLMCDRLTRRLSTARLTFFSVLLTAIALLGFSTCSSYPQLILWAIPYGLGAGSIDAALNNYVALHYASRHMSWLHCMWGVGASVGPMIMSLAITRGLNWTGGYRIVGIIQSVLTVILFLSLPLWKAHAQEPGEAKDTATKNGPVTSDRPLSLKEIISLKGAIHIMVSFFCYCAIEQTVGLWGSSYLHLARGIDASRATAFGSFFFIGVMAGRALSGFMTMRFNDSQMVRIGQALILTGALLLLLPLPEHVALSGLIILGLGCAPVYPSLIHMTPERFGAVASQAVIGVEMASAYVGTSLMPPLFGLVSNLFGVRLFPVYLLCLLAFMIFMHERLCRIART